jgi:hypothetical protein
MIAGSIEQTSQHGEHGGREIHQASSIPAGLADLDDGGFEFPQREAETANLN